ncbi:hypothetical protein BDI4_210037 [Burkholderia diffusa]|nr:hypothetical protein BDI4_210037 [Burkholderia diffusa]
MRSKLCRISDFDQLERTFGIVIPDVLDDTTRLLAMDAEEPLITAPNAGIPAWLANYITPEFIQILTAPNRVAEILGEAKKGDWTTFPVIESTGEVSSYGDYNENSSVSANADFPQRQSYHYQMMTQWGERYLEISSLAKIDHVARVNVASAKSASSVKVGVGAHTANVDLSGGDQFYGCGTDAVGRPDGHRHARRKASGVRHHRHDSRCGVAPRCGHRCRRRCAPNRRSARAVADCRDSECAWPRRIGLDRGAGYYVSIQDASPALRRHTCVASDDLVLHRLRERAATLARQYRRDVGASMRTHGDTVNRTTGYCCCITFTIQLIPKRSVTMPNPAAQKVD